METISAIVLTRNEEKNIARCLQSLRWADEIIVIDSESTDHTREIAEAEGARVIVHQWQGAGAQYAFGIAQATCDWVMVVDADEEVTPELKGNITNVLQIGGRHSGYYLTRQNFALGRWLRHGGWQEQVLRLFRRGSVESPPTLHPRFKVAGTAGKLDGILRHYMAQDFLEWWFRSMRLARSEAEGDFTRGERFSGFELISAFWKFLRRYTFKFGFLDGAAGFYACFQRFLYIAVKEACLLELQLSLRKPSGAEKIPFK